MGGVTIKASPNFTQERKRTIWNKRLDNARAPDAVVTVRSAEEVAEAIRFASANCLKVSPRGGGHHYGAAALRDGGLLLDLGALDFVEIDANSRIARVGAGVRGDKLSERLAAHGFAFPVGHCADVSVSGYMLNGGFGWNAGEWGAACRNIAAIEMVTADGDIVLASEEHYPELFWAARGAGPGFFAAVTAYHLNLHPLPPVTCAWRSAFPATDAPLLADWLTAVTDLASPETEVGCFLMSHWETGEPAIVLRVSACGEHEAEAKSRLASFASPPSGVHTIGQSHIETLPFTDLFKLSPMPEGKRVAADHLWANAVLGDALAGSLRRSLAEPAFDDRSGRIWRPFSRAAAQRCRAFDRGRHRGRNYAMWDDPAEDGANCAWVRQIDDALSSFRSGRYVGEAELTASPARLAECFTPDALEHLTFLRRKYDPRGLFYGWP